MTEIFILNKNNVEEIRTSLGAFIDQKQTELQTYDAQYQEEISKARDEGRPDPMYSPDPFPRIIISGELLCEVCGKKCGMLDFDYRKGVDGVIEKLNELTSLCEDHV